MKSRMMVLPGPALGAALALGALAAAGPLSSTQAQEPPKVRVESQECRCVDRDGKEIPNCTCFTTPDVGRIMVRAMPMRDTRARLGVTITEDVDADDAPRGARIQSLMEDGPAAEAGLQKGDVITALDGKSLLAPLDAETEKDLFGPVAVERLMALIRDVEPGQEVRVDYLRDGESRSATVTARELDNWSVRMAVPAWSDAGEMAEAMADMRGRLRELRFEGREPSVFQFRVPHAPGEPGAPHAAVRVGPGAFFLGASGECPGDRTGAAAMGWLSQRCVAGVALEALNPKLGEYFGTNRGVLVTDVGEDSTLGLEPGDVILEIGGREATDPERVRKILGSYDDEEPITLRIMRQKREMSVQGSLGG